jgi:hypothetical protein
LGQSFPRHCSKRPGRLSIRKLVSLSSFFALALMGAAVIGWHGLARPSLQTFSAAHSDWEKNDVRTSLAMLAGQVAAGDAFANRRPVYRYSVVPGGVQSGEELRQATQRDRAVARHFAAFNFERAQVTQLRAPRFVYLSYRRGDRIFWTRKQIALRKGEQLITDGKIAARTRCANQISVLPHAETSMEEPLAQELDDPADQGGSARNFDSPGPIEAQLMRRPGPHGFGAEGPPLRGTGPLFGPSGGGFPGIFPPPVISDSCEPMPKPKPKGGLVASAGDQTSDKKKKNGCTPPPTPPPATVPEPASIVLVASGIAGICARARMRRRASRKAP